MTLNEWIEHLRHNRNRQILLRSDQIGDLIGALEPEGSGEGPSPQPVVTTGEMRVCWIDAEILDKLPRLGDGTPAYPGQEVWDGRGVSYELKSLVYTHRCGLPRVRAVAIDTNGTSHDLALSALASTPPAQPAQPTIEDRLSTVEEFVRKALTLPGINGMFD